eukprot:7384796-Prymnesium_polylepis.2
MQTDSQGRRALKLRSGRNAASAELGVILMARAATPVVSRPVLATLRHAHERIKIGACWHTLSETRKRRCDVEACHTHLRKRVQREQSDARDVYA